MLVISKEVINAVGYQIQPSQRGMSPYERADFERILCSLTNKEIIVLKEKQKIEKLTVLTNLFNNLKTEDPLRDFYHNKIKNLLEE